MEQPGTTVQTHIADRLSLIMEMEVPEATDFPEDRAPEVMEGQEGPAAAAQSVNAFSIQQSTAIAQNVWAVAIDCCKCDCRYSFNALVIARDTVIIV